jgi:hypothetical protein
LHFAADVLDPAWACERLRTADAVTELRMVAAGPVSRVPAGPRERPEADQEGMEEGTL